MKKLSSIFFVGIIGLAASCTSQQERYLDLRTGEHIEAEKTEYGAWVNAETKQPVYIIVDTKTNDTLYGKTGEVINGKVVKVNDTEYRYDGDTPQNTEVTGEYKMKVEEDGDVKIKTDDKKVKIDGETGEKKVKYDD